MKIELAHVKDSIPTLVALLFHLVARGACFSMDANSLEVNNKLSVNSDSVTSHRSVFSSFHFRLAIKK